MAAVPGSSSENETRFDPALNLVVAMLRWGILGLNFSLLIHSNCKCFFFQFECIIMSVMGI